MNALRTRLRFLAATGWERIRRRLPWDRHGKRLLVHEILSIQVLSAAIFGGLAIASRVDISVIDDPSGSATVLVSGHLLVSGDRAGAAAAASW